MDEFYYSNMMTILQRHVPPMDEVTGSGCVHIRKNCIDKFYEEAAWRLPLEEMRELEGCIRAGGLCFGLSDPVSNIVLNTIALLHHDQQEQEHLPPQQRDFRVRRGAKGWADIGYRSLDGLQVFMTSYFCYLSDTDAATYLYVASQNLPLAIALVHQVHCVGIEAPLLPDGGKLKSALRIAAIRAQHPVPDVLAQLMTARYPRGQLSHVMSKLLFTAEQLTTHDISAIRDMLAHQWPPAVSPINMDFWCRPKVSPTCTQSDDGMVQITTCIGEECRLAKISVATSQDRLPFDDHCRDLEYIWPLFCCKGVLKKIQTVGQFIRTPQRDGLHWLYGDLTSSKMCLLDRISSLYIRVLSIVPCSPRFLRALLLAGHIYGPVDPLSNVIINTIWYDISFPPTLGAEDKLPQGILETKAISRLASRNLDGILTMLQESNGHFVSYLHLLINLGNPFGHSMFTTKKRSILDAAAKAAKHPQHAAFGSFLASLNMDNISRLICFPGLLGSERISDATLNQLETILRDQCHVQPERMGTDARHPCLSPRASNHVLKKKLDVQCTLAFVYSELKKLLNNYCYQHPWEPTYHVDIVCGVWTSSSPNRPNVCHANFLACTSVDVQRTLFFAEFWLSSLPLPSGVSLKPSFCCPIYGSFGVYSIGRCSFCEMAQSKIVHPPSGHSGIIEGQNDSYSGAVSRVDSEELLDLDLVYFDHDVDKDLVNAIERLSGYEHNEIPMNYWLDRAKPSSLVWEWSSRNPFGPLSGISKH